MHVYRVVLKSTITEQAGNCEQGVSGLDPLIAGPLVGQDG